MGKALLLALVAAVVVAFLVPFEGQTLWQRAERRGIPAAASRAVRVALRWFGEAHSKRSHLAAAPNAAAGRRAPDSGADRILKAPPKERLSPDDRASLDRLVHSRAR
ncbi:MAG: hypothetical protein ACJ79H_08970 [Myxococcales bacterium]